MIIFEKLTPCNWKCRLFGSAEYKDKLLLLVDYIIHIVQFNYLPFLLNFTGDGSEDDSPQTLDEILRQIPPSHTSPQVQDMVEESQRNRDRELIQERDALFSQPQAAQTSTVFDSF